MKVFNTTLLFSEVNNFHKSTETHVQRTTAKTEVLTYKDDWRFNLHSQKNKKRLRNSNLIPSRGLVLEDFRFGYKKAWQSWASASLPTPWFFYIGMPTKHQRTSDKKKQSSYTQRFSRKLIQFYLTVCWWIYKIVVNYKCSEKVSMKFVLFTWFVAFATIMIQSSKIWFRKKSTF